MKLKKLCPEEEEGVACGQRKNNKEVQRQKKKEELMACVLHDLGSLEPWLMEEAPVFLKLILLTTHKLGVRSMGNSVEQITGYEYYTSSPTHKQGRGLRRFVPCVKSYLLAHSLEAQK
ncbi:hypothetical protein M0R45_030815 [Rubus argutus]|uniref:Uncharacterized protein n=1 Tax=Rubus argutus TaxID=59490 RepID=A0AAW1WFD4_RUBAR